MTLAEHYPARLVCRLLGFPRCALYRAAAPPAADAPALRGALVRLAGEWPTYGYRRLTAMLRREGHAVNGKRVRRLMAALGIQGKAPARRARTTNSDHPFPRWPNLVEGLAVVRPDQVWVADITYVPTAQGWLFLAAVMDLYSRQILGWSLWQNLEAGGPLQALARALANRRPRRGVIHHSDQGIQYACRDYRQLLQRHGLIASMSRKGNCYDNAAMEAFWSTLKREALEESSKWSENRVSQIIFEYIEAIYNRSRLHSSLGYQSPVDYETKTKYEENHL